MQLASDLWREQDPLGALTVGPCAVYENEAEAKIAGLEAEFEDAVDRIAEIEAESGREKQRADDAEAERDARHTSKCLETMEFSRSLCQPIWCICGVEQAESRAEGLQQELDAALGEIAAILEAYPPERVYKPDSGTEFGAVMLRLHALAGAAPQPEGKA